MSKIKVIACSGIGKAFGLMAREAVLKVTNELNPQEAETACLAHIITGDAEGREKVADQICITVDGCPALCSAKSVESEGGIVKAKFRVVDEMRNHRGAKAGNGTQLTEDGWKITDELAEKISAKVTELVEEGKNNA